MSGITIIGVIGSSRSGKSTLANYLVDNHGFTRMRFADPLKEMLITMGLTRDQVDGPSEVRNAPSDLLLGNTPRFAMQTLGTEWRDLLDKRLWSNICHQRIVEKLNDGVDRIVIDDMRFHHEVDMINNIGGMTLAVRNDRTEPSERRKLLSRIPLSFAIAEWLRSMGISYLHQSEKEWFQITPNYTIENHAGLHELFREIDTFVEKEL